MGRPQSKELGRIAAASVRDLALIAARRNGGEEMQDLADKVAALLDAVEALDAIGAAYALIGGVAVGVHSGVPRATLDTDIAVISTTPRASLTEAMIRFGIKPVGEFEHSSNFRHPSGEPVQLAIDPSFDPMIERAESMSVEGRAISLIRKDDLIEMKRRAASDPKRRKSKALRDQADIELLLGDIPDPDEGW